LAERPAWIESVQMAGPLGQMQAINAGRTEAKDRIGGVLRGHGWPV
jgi:hypothetical protein